MGHAVVELSRAAVGGQIPEGRVVLTKGLVTFEGVSPALRRVIVAISIGRSRLTPSDGRDYLKALPRFFRGSQLQARYIGRAQRRVGDGHADHRA